MGAWHLIRVPGAWETNGPAAARIYDGYAWYRAWLKPHDGFFLKHERNLFEESVTLNIRDLADAHEVFVNGARIGGGGSFPPEFRSGRAGNHRHKVPPGLLRKGEWNEIAIRVFNPSGAGGFLGEAPFIMDYFNECVMEGEWDFRLGDDPTWKSGALKEKPIRAAFDQYRESSGVLGEAAQLVHGPKLPPTESLAKLKTADDLAVDSLLAEPLVAQPTHLSFDSRGRLWVAQYRQYPYPAGVKMLSRDKYYRAHYDKVPPPPPHHTPGRDVVSIHEDTNADGVFDKHKVFLDGLNMCNAALPGRGGVWLMHTPYLVFYPDRDGNDVPDGAPTVHLAGFGLEDTHSVANGLVWGPDGWIYGAQGSTTSSRVTRPGIDPPDAPGVYFEGCMVWRYDPETRTYEIFAEGSGNVFGLEIDAQGRLFSGHNGPETRGWHYMQGGFYMKQGVDPGKFGPPRNPYSFGQLPWMKPLSAFQRFSHTLAVVEGTALPASRAGQLLFLDPVHSLVLAAERKPTGPTFDTKDIGQVLTSADEAFRPVYIVNAPDGSIYLADFYEHYIAHGQHYQSQIDPTTGRIYRLRGKEASLEKDVNLSRKSAGELIALLSHPNKWHRQMAVRVLAERKSRSTTARLKKLIAASERETPVPRDSSSGNVAPASAPALEALWVLHQSGALDEATALAALRHRVAAVRMWTVRLLADREKLSPKVWAAVLEQTRCEADIEVRAQIAASARRLPVSQALPLVEALLVHDEDVADACLPVLCWWVLENKIKSDRNAVLALFKSAQLWDRPMVHEHMLPRLMRRFALEGRRQDLLVCAELLRFAPAQKHAAQLMKGFEEAYRGRAMAGLPDELLAAMSASGSTPLILRVRQSEPAAVAQVLGMIQDEKAKLEDRLLYARAFGEVRNASALPILLATAAGNSKPELRKAALGALSAYEDASIATHVVELLPKLPVEVRSAAFALLTSRTKWTLEMLGAIQDAKIKLSIVPPDVADRLRLSKDKDVRELAAKFFPKPDAAKAAAVQKRIADVETVLKQRPGSPYAGEALFTERCASCHKLFFKGGNVGPDLTAYQRDNLGTMLVSILNPNAEIREGYEYVEIETTDDRSLAGFLTDRDAQVTVLRGLDGQDVTLRAAEVKSIQPTGRSLMPEGLVDDLTEQQLRDLFAFLRSSQPFTR